MKKLTFLTAFLMLFVFMSYADNWTETFDDQTANSYTATSYTINGRVWTCSGAGNFVYANTNMGSPAFTINDDIVGANITSPVLNTCGTVSFKYAYINGLETNVFVVQKSTDGATWTDIDAHTLGTLANLSYVNYSFSVNDASTALYIRVLSDNQNAHLFIEDFAVTSYSTTPELTWSATTFNEAIANDGSISNTLTLALANETFTTALGQLVENTDYTVANVPAGLTLAIGTSNNQTAVIGITGNATNHANIDDIANLTITFLNAAFTGNDASAVTASSKTDLVVDFMDGAPAKEMAWSATSFTENIANNGSISNTITVSLTSETFTTVGALVSGADFGVLNVPAGLTVEITTTSVTEATISLKEMLLLTKIVMILLIYR